MIFLGVDPGISGAVAFLTITGTLKVFDMPSREIDGGGKNKREIDSAAMAALIRRETADHKELNATFERVGAMPGQGVTSMFSFGRSVGMIEGILAALTIPVSYVAPVKWKRAMQVPAGKDGARLRASQMMPAYAAEWRLKKHDGRAEAALIALYGMTNGTKIVSDAPNGPWPPMPKSDAEWRKGHEDFVASGGVLLCSCGGCVEPYYCPMHGWIGGKPQR